MIRLHVNVSAVYLTLNASHAVFIETRRTWRYDQSNQKDFTTLSTFM